jgi:hypothetical protein
MELVARNLLSVRPTSAKAEQRAAEWLNSTKKSLGFADVEEEHSSKKKMVAGAPKCEDNVVRRDRSQAIRRALLLGC